MELTEDLPRPPQHSSQSIAQAAALISQLSDVLARRRDRAAGETHTGNPQAGVALRGQTVGSSVGADTVAADVHRQRADDALGAATGEEIAVEPGAGRAAALDAASGDLGLADTQTSLSAAALTEALDAVTTADQAFAIGTTTSAPVAVWSVTSRTSPSMQNQTPRNR